MNIFVNLVESLIHFTLLHVDIPERPIAVGPKQYTSPVCLGCHAPVSLAGYRSIIDTIFASSNFFTRI